MGHGPDLHRIQDFPGGGWVGKREIKTNLSPTELPAGAGTELGNRIYKPYLEETVNI